MNNIQFSTQQLLEAQNELLSLQNSIPTVLAKINNALSSVMQIPNTNEPEQKISDIMKAPEVTKEFGIPISTLYTLSSRGEIPTIKIPGKRTAYSREELTDFFNKGKIPAKSQILDGSKNLHY